MTSASVLFYNRRSRVGRGGFLDLGLGGEGIDTSDNDSPRISHQNNIRRQRLSNSHLTTRRDHHRLDVDGCEPLPRRALHLTNHPPRRLTNSGSEAASLVHASSQSDTRGETNPQHGSTRRERLRFTGSERLPSAVLHARERLFQRLRGTSLSETRRDNRDPLSNLHGHLTTEESEFRSPDAGDRESSISSERLTGILSFPGLPLEKSNRPPALTQEVLNSLQTEIFIRLDTSTGDTVLQDCSICLDSFCEGDKLMSLPCGHKFHHRCLHRWLLICGDCPYCRARILLTSC